MLADKIKSNYTKYLRGSIFIILFFVVRTILNEIDEINLKTGDYLMFQVNILGVYLSMIPLFFVQFIAGKRFYNLSVIIGTGLINIVFAYTFLEDMISSVPDEPEIVIPVIVNLISAIILVYFHRKESKRNQVQIL